MNKTIMLKWVERHVDEMFMSAFYDMELRVVESGHPLFREGVRVGWQELKEMAKDGVEVLIVV